MIYLGGSIDYVTHDPRASWQHRLPDLMGLDPDADFFCPRCRNLGVADDDSIYENNLRALDEAEIAIFYLDGSFTVGTPIEIEFRVNSGKANSTYIVHPIGPPGLYVRRWQRAGVIVGKSFGEVGHWLELR